MLLVKPLFIYIVYSLWQLRSFGNTCQISQLLLGCKKACTHEKLLNMLYIFKTKKHSPWKIDCWTWTLQNIMHSLNIRDDFPQGENKKFEWEILSLAKLSKLCFLRNISFSTKMKIGFQNQRLRCKLKQFHKFRGR